jgi:hypothetical protein
MAEDVPDAPTRGETGSANVKPPFRPRSPKTAVILVHGMGEQRPMETLWRFVKAAWIHNPDVGATARNDVFSQPSIIPGNYELRRITTRYAALDEGKDRRVDFFEFYWAHMMTGNTGRSLIGWLSALFLRAPGSVPKDLIGFWVIGVALYALTTAFLAIAAARAADIEILAIVGIPDAGAAGWYTVAAVVAFLAGWLATLVTPVAGDAARYLSPDPDNVRARQEIREAGVDLIQRITNNGYHDRIVLVGHSLGTVIAYDILTHAWGTLTQTQWFSLYGGDPAANALLSGKLEAVELSADRVTTDLAAFRKSQRNWFAALNTAAIEREVSSPWIVSDLVTLGSPLSKANVLMARNDKLFVEKKQRMEFPTCPPQFEKKSEPSDPSRFSFVRADPAKRLPNTGAVFSAVVWTNVWFPSLFVVFGDFVSGPVSRLFGGGVRDICIPLAFPKFRHLDYWKNPEAGDDKAPWLSALRQAINLRRVDN